jgi:hypothetical protein
VNEEIFLEHCLKEKIINQYEHNKYTEKQKFKGKHQSWAIDEIEKVHSKILKKFSKNESDKSSNNIF